jgi:hypothetical protein
MNKIAATALISMALPILSTVAEEVKITQEYAPEVRVATFQVAASTDDAAAVTNATGELASTMYWPYTTTARMSFLRWQSTIPRGAAITKAYVKVRSNGTAGNTNSSVIRLEVLDTDNAPLFTSSDNPFYDAVMTNYVDSTVPGAWSVGTWATSDDIKSLVQAYIDRPDYAYGNYIGLRGSFVSGAYKGAYTWNYGDHSGAPQLEVHYTGGEVLLELWMADPETRLGQKVYCQIINRSSTDTLRVKLDGTVIHTKAAPLSETEEIFTANYRTLGIGSHTLLVEILDAGGAVRTSANRTWTKLHDGIAKVAINENNAICRNGVPFFPITPWGIGAGAFPTWEGQINALTGQSWGIAKNLTGWKTFLQSIQAYDYPVMGPAFGDYWPGGYTDNDVDIDGVHVYFKELDMNRVTEYINASKNDPSMLMYVWHDEPDLGGPDQYIPATEVRRWTDKVHEMDTEHPHYLNLVGYPFTHKDPYPNYNNLEAQSYCFLFNDKWSTPMGTNQPFAKKTLVADILAFDYYPYDLALNPTYSNWIGLADLTLALDRMREWNYNLAPTMTWIETCDVLQSVPNPPAPTATELNNLIWLSIIHQVKGIQWFHYFEPTSAENRAVMQTTTEWITSLTQPILSAPENVTWTVSNQGISGGRVDFMTRQYDDRLYIFSTSIPTNGILTNGMATASVRFDMPGLTNGAKVGVLGEGRIITASDGYFEDTFSPLAVHIYTYPAMTNLPPAAKAGRDLLIPDTDLNGSETVTLADAGSFDPDGTITSYVWMKGAAQIATGATAQVSLTNGTHTITLIVTDDGGSTGSSTISVTVNPPPAAHAGEDQQVDDIDNDGFALITLNGSASTDDKPLASYVWTESGNVVATGMTAQVSLFAATHDITLEVTDSNGQTDSDIVQIIVVNPNVVNVQYQIAAAGDDTVAYTNASGYLSSTMYFPYSSTNRLVFLRWPLNIPAGATILSADLQVKSAGTKGDENPSTVGLRLVDSDSAPSFVANPYDLPVTATTEDWTLEGAWVTNQWYKSGNLHTLVQEFIDRSGYVSGSYLGLRCAHLSGNWKTAYQWDNSGNTDGTILQVTYLPTTSFSLTYTTGAHGTISGTATQTVVSGENGSAVTAVPDSGYQFVNWSDGSTANPRTDTNVTNDLNITANFSSMSAETVNVQYQIAASGDDAWTSTNSPAYSNSKMYFPYSSTTRLVFLRWALEIPSGATIVSADLQVKSAGTKGDANSSTVRLQLVDSDNTSPFTTLPYYLPVTAITADWILPGAWATNQWYASGNIKTLVQEFVNRPSYVSGNYLGLRCSNLSGSWKEAYQWDNGTHTDGAILRVTYQVASSDSDGDGIPDSWETLYFGGATNANAAALAANGVNTVMETYVAGLNPTNPASVFLIYDFRSLPAGNILQWGAVSGRVYSIYWTTNLLNGFQPLGANILWPQNSWTDLVHGAENEGFYRIKVNLGL